MDRQSHLPDQLASTLPLSRADLDAHRTEAESTLQRMIARQEQLDWRCYVLYDVSDDDLTYATSLQRSDDESADQVPSIRLGERAFEIVMARRMAKGELTTTWFERHGSTPVTELPDHWSDDYRALVERRIALIESDRNIGLVEQPEYKRRWNQESWEKQEQRALRGWLLDRLETSDYWPEVAVQTTDALADRAQTDADFRAVAELYKGRPDFSMQKLVAELVVAESVPFPAPPKYRTPDFVDTTVWRLRGPLDVPKERFVSYPHCVPEDETSLVVGWAGWDHREQAIALVSHYTALVEQHGWSAERLRSAIAGLKELIPWIKQWHNDVDPEFDIRMGDYFAEYLAGELQKQGLTNADLESWQPPPKRARRKKSAGRRKAA